MFNWNSGVTWNSGAVWGPAPASPSLFVTRHRPSKPNQTMKRKPYFPDRNSERPEWFHNFATQLPQANTVLNLDAAVVSARVADALYCEYLCGPWLTWVRECGPTATAAVETLFNAQSAGDYLPPVFNPPALPQGDAAATPPVPATVPVPAGALRRIQDFVAILKRSPGYTDDIGQQLAIIGPQDSAVKDMPEFTLKVERGGGCECVRVVFKKFGRQGVVVASRRGGGDWEQLGVDFNSPYMDERPLLVPGQPEVREYRLQFYVDDSPSGPVTPVQSVTVAA